MRTWRKRFSPTFVKKFEEYEEEYKILLPLYFFLAIVTGWVSFHGRKLGIDEAAAFQHGIYLRDRSHDILSIIHAKRILFPYILHYFSKFTGLPLPHAFALIRLVSIFVAYTLFHFYLRKWFELKIALVGTLFLVATIQMTFLEWFEIPTDFIELIVFILGFLCMREGMDYLLYLLIAVGTLNRETTGFLAIAYFFYLWDGRNTPLRIMVKAAPAFLIWFIIYLSLMLHVGITQPEYYYNPNSLRHSIEGISRLLVNFNIYNNYLSFFYLFNMFWVFALLRIREKPPFIRRILRSVPLILIIYMVGGGLGEPREIITLYPLLIPAGLFTLFPGSKERARPSVQAALAEEKTSR